jgi:hypothetical protein
MNNNRNLVLVSMILCAALSRLIPHPPNFTAVGALALFGGVQLSRRGPAFLAPLGALILSDLMLGLHPLIPWVYGSFCLVVGLGMCVPKEAKPCQIALASLAGSLLFYFVTNFGVWVMLDTYPQTALGLLECYVAGLPSLVNTALGDLCYSALLFGGFALAQLRFVSVRPKVVSPNRLLSA